MQSQRVWAGMSAQFVRTNHELSFTGLGPQVIVRDPLAVPCPESSHPYFGPSLQAPKLFMHRPRLG